MPATSARISRHCSRRAGPQASAPERAIHMVVRQQFSARRTVGDGGSEVHHEALVECFRGCRVRELEPGHDLHRLRARRTPKRARQRKTRNSNPAGMDRCLAGTTRARCSRSPSHRRRAERSDVMNPRATRTERDRAPDSARALTEREVAERLGLSVATLRAWRHRGKGPRYLRLGRSVRYLPSDVAEFVRESAVDTRSESSSDEDSELGGLHV